MSPKKITVVNGSGSGESNESVGNDNEFKALIDDYAVRYLITANPQQINIRGFESLVDGGKYTLGPPQQQQLQPNGQIPEVLSQGYSQEVWKSVLRICSDVEEDCATALVFDVHFDGKGAFLYLLTNHHYELQAGNTYRLEYCTPDNKFLEVDMFDYEEFHIYESSEQSDFVIYKLLLDQKIWDVGMGTATRKLEQGSIPSAKRARPHRIAEHKSAPRASVVCKTPQFWYLGINPSDTVRVYALPAAAPGRWEANTTITTVDRLSFYLQNLSGPGGSGGAVVTTKSGIVIGYMGGAYDVKELDDTKKIVKRRFNSYAFTVHALPRRLSSPLPSSSHDLASVVDK